MGKLNVYVFNDVGHNTHLTVKIVAISEKVIEDVDYEGFAKLGAEDLTKNMRIEIHITDVWKE